MKNIYIDTIRNASLGANWKSNKGYAFHQIEATHCGLAEIVLVKEDTKGYYRINNGYYVADYDADEFVKSENAKLGLSEEQAMDIILTTMGV
tara:strand:+ start:210 stop:485 length:276 start_codon:yes stop_codon:yes gene_type:complete